MKFISWNVNGFRAVLNKGFVEIFNELDADFFCLQETKMQENQHDFEPEGYFSYFNYAQRKGYSGTAIFSKKEALCVKLGIGIEKFDDEGRVITCEYDDFYLVTCYTPNSKRELLRLNYRMEWEDAFQDFCVELTNTKPVIVCGDLNVAHTKIDLKNPIANRLNAGFSDEERDKMTQFLNQGFIDSYRYFHPDQKDAYTWWSYLHNSRERNIGWRIDYFLVAEELEKRMKSATIHSHIMGSDHCPVELELD